MMAQIAKLAGYYLLRCAQSDLVIAFNRLATALKAVDETKQLPIPPSPDLTVLRINFNLQELEGK